MDEADQNLDLEQSENSSLGGLEFDEEQDLEQRGLRPGGLELDEADQKQVLNQVERFERLMTVLGLLKGATSMEEMGSGIGGGSSSVAEIQDIKEHIKLALDEAVQLRRETTAMQNKIGVRNTTTTNSTHSSPVSS